MSTASVRYLSDERGDVTDVVVPIALWREIAAEIETEHLRSSPAMRERILDALADTETIAFDDAMERLGVR